MNINTLHKLAVEGDKSAERNLFAVLTESFGLFLQQRVENDSDAEEIVQDAVTTIAQHYLTLEVQKSFAAWAYRVLENKLLYYYRTRANRRKRSAPWTETHEETAAPTPDPDFKRRLLDCLRQIASANLRRARVLNLHYQGFDAEGISRRMNMTRNGMYVLLSRARTLLRECLDKRNHRS